MHRSLALLCLVLGVACSEVPATNPFDPSTPAAQQATGRVSGRLVLPDGFAWDGPRAGATIELRAAENPNEVAYSAVVDAEGAFAIADVGAGAYTAAFVVPTMSADAVALVVPRGGAVDLGEIPLRAVAESSLQGKARRAGEADDAHGGIFVQVVGTPYNALTSADGTFRIALTAGTFTVRASAAGYGTVDRQVELGGGQALVLDEPLELSGAPAAVRGTIVLPSGFDERGLEALSVRLFAGGADMPQATAALQRTSAPEERPIVAAFDFGDLAAGPWRLRIDSDSFHPFQRDFRLAVGEQADLGAIALFDVAAEAPGYLTGKALLAGQPDDGHGGTRVEVLGTPFVALTVADGSYRVAVGPGRYRVRFVHDGYGTGEAEAPEVGVGGEAILPDVTLVGTPGRLRGSIALEAGFAAPEAVADVDLRLMRDGEEHAQTRPDMRGVFVFDAVPPGEYLLVADRDGFVTREVPVDVAFGRLTDVGQIVLDAVTLRVRLAGHARLAGRAVHDEIQVALEGTDLRATTDADGAYAIEAPLRQAAYALRFTRAGYNAEEAQATPPSSEQVAAHLAAHAGEAAPPPITVAPDPAEVTLAARPGSIRGRVTLAAGFEDADLLGRVVVRLVDFDRPDDPPRGETSPDARGTYLFSNVQPGTYGIEFELEGFFGQPLQATLQPGEDVVVAGRVLSPDAQGDRAFIEGMARRACEGQCDHGGIRVEALNYPFVTFTGRDGQYRLEVIALDDYTLVFSAPGYESAQVLGVDAVADETTPLEDVTLPARPGEVRALVALRQYGTEARLQGVDATLWTDPPGDAPLRSVNPDARGEVVFAGVLPGRYEVRADAAGYLPQTRRVAVGPGETALAGAFDLAHDATAPDAPRLGGAVRLDDAAEHAGTDVRVRIAGDDLAFGDPLRTAADGRFELPASPDERYTVTVARAGYDAVARIGPLSYDAADGRFEDEAGRPVDVTLRRTPVPGSIRGLVSLRSYSSAARLQAVDVALWADPPGAAAVRTVRPDGRGEFVFADVPPGRYEVRLSAIGYDPQARRVALAPAGDVLAGVFELVHASEGPNAVLLAGRVTLSGAADHGGTTVRARIAGPDLAFAAPLVTDADGRFEVRAARDERYTLQVSHPGYTAPGAIGPLSWVQARNRFEDDGGQPAERLLARTPIQGRIQLAVDVQPAWLPAAERYARVRLVGPVSDTEEPVFPGGGGVTFTDLPEGTYTVRVERAGFSVVDRQVQLTLASPTADLGTLAISLANLAEARIDLRGQQVTACNLRASNISLRNAYLGGVTLTGDLGQAVGCPAGARQGPLDLTGADLSGANLTGARLARTAAGPVVLASARLANAALAGVDLTGVDARGADFFAADLTDATLATANLEHANFTEATLRRVRFARPRLDAGGQPDEDPQSPWPTLWGTLEGLPARPCEDANRAAVNLNGAVLSRADLNEAFMPGVMMRGLVLAGAQIADADLRHTCLDGAQLTLLDLSGTVLDGADLRRSEFTSSLLRKTSLRGATLSEASLVGTVLDRADLRPSPRAECAQLVPWEEYRPRGDCVPEPDAACRCRTLLNGASLDGANLVGTSFEGVDLAGASLLGVTLGQVPGAAFAQPQRCQPEEYWNCQRVYEVLAECEFSGMDPRTAEATCQDDPETLEFGVDAFSANKRTCVLIQARNGANCNTIRTNCIDGNPGAAQPPANNCTWASLRADEDAGDPLGSQCRWPLPDGEVRLHEACKYAPTVLNDVRLDGAQMTAVVMNGIQLDGVSMRTALVRSATFHDNAFGEIDFTSADLRNVTLAGAALEGVNFNNADLTGADLAGAVLDGSNLEDADFSDADLSGASLQFDPRDGSRPESFARADLRDTTITGARWTSDPGNGMNLTGADLSGAQLLDTWIEYGYFSRGTFRGTNFQEDGKFNGATFIGASFVGSTLTADFSNASFNNAHISGGFMSIGSLGVLMQAADFTDATIVGVNAQFVRWEDARLSGATITDTNLDRVRAQRVDGRELQVSGSNLRGAEFQNANLRDARMADNNLSRWLNAPVTPTRFQSACLRRVDFRRSNLEYAEFTNADVQAANFQGAFMRNADLTNACQLTFFFGAFNGADLHNARICTRDQATFNQRNTYAGTPVWVNCAAQPVCPAGCN